MTYMQLTSESVLAGSNRSFQESDSSSEEAYEENFGDHLEWKDALESPDVACPAKSVEQGGLPTSEVDDSGELEKHFTQGDMIPGPRAPTMQVPLKEPQDLK